MKLAYPVDALVSYHYYRREDLMLALTEPGHLRMIGDSGAFSAYTQGAPVQLEEYARWCLRWRKHLSWMAALDVIGDATATHRNWQILRDEFRLDTVPTLHAGGDVKWLDAYAAEGVDYVGLGGLVGVALRAFRWLVHVFRYARDNHPGMRFHLWGVTNRRILEALPTYSADSSGIMGTAYRYGRQRLFDPRTGRDAAFALNGREAFRHRDLLHGTYGVEPGQVARSTPANRALLIQLAAASTQQYAGWLQRRHKVSPPAWGLQPSGTGPKVHLAGDCQAGIRQDGLLTLAQAGPRVHLVDAMPRHLMELQPKGAK